MEFLKEFSNNIIESRILKKRTSTFAQFPTSMTPMLLECLVNLGYSRLYSHQAEMFDQATMGENVIITTGTASGKSLSFYLPVFQQIIQNPFQRAIFIYPTKALAQDQLKNLKPFQNYFGDRILKVGIYDGDTPASQRKKIREEANIILTNPDMINSSFLPNHNRYGFPHIFKNLEYVVVDELHIYRGAFGSHLSNVMRRLIRICHYHNKVPKFLCSSATIANPLELAQNICHSDFKLVSKDGSPAGEKEILFWQPPFIGKKETFIRATVRNQMIRFLPKLITDKHRFIAFCRSRKDTEIITKECRDKLIKSRSSIDLSNKIAGYRGGYTPIERRKIEKDLLDEKITGVVSTNALELGIDIGSLEFVVMGGFPGTRASFWQQVGRVGRTGKKSYAILIMDDKPLDQYVGKNPDWLLGNPSENAIVDKNNLYIQLSHIRASSAELPLTIDDLKYFPDLGEILPMLQDIGELKQVQNSYHWQGESSPAHEISLRNISNETVDILYKNGQLTLTTIDLKQAKFELYCGAIYLHETNQYLCTNLDLESCKATVVDSEGNYFTEPHIISNIDILVKHKEKTNERIKIYFGDIKVTRINRGYKMLQFGTHTNLGYNELSNPLYDELDTEGCWIELPKNVQQVLTEASLINDPTVAYTVGLVHALKSCSEMQIMATFSDIGGDSFNYGEDNLLAVIIYDQYMGGLGFSEKIYDKFLEIKNKALSLIKSCPCLHGCPICVKDFRIDKHVIIWALENFDTLTNPPNGIQINQNKNQIIQHFDFKDIPEKWNDIVNIICNENLCGSSILKAGKSISLDDNSMTITLSSGLQKLIEQSNMIENISKSISSIVTTPSSFKLSFIYTTDSDSTIKVNKIERYLQK